MSGIVAEQGETIERIHDDVFHAYVLLGSSHHRCTAAPTRCYAMLHCLPDKTM